MLLRGRIALLLGSLALAGCGGALHSQQPPEKQQPPAQWTTGFWLWQGSPAAPAPDGLTVDVLYFQAGTINQRVPGAPEIKELPNWDVYGALPKDLPPAREYWMVFRFGLQSVPGLSAAPLLTSRIAQLRTFAQQRNLNLAGVQLDIDSPTASLPKYADFLAEVRKNLPPGFGLSITALLDWFHDGTAIAQVIQQVDEFVPQFYDADAAAFARTGAISAKLDAGKWGPVFNRFNKRFRIGLASFGRAKLDDRLYADLVPLDIALNPAFTLETSHTDAGDLVLTYRATRPVQITSYRFPHGATVQFILPTAAVIRTSVQSARGIGGNCAGVVFFRWPTLNETLIMLPAEVLAAAGAGPQLQNPAPTVQLVEGSCAVVKCRDLYLLNANPFSPTPLRYRIHSSAQLEYFLPEKRIPVRMSGPSDLELSLPPYAGRSRMLLGRAVSKTSADFIAQLEP